MSEYNGFAFYASTEIHINILDVSNNELGINSDFNFHFPRLMEWYIRTSTFIVDGCYWYVSILSITWGSSRKKNNGVKLLGFRIYTNSFSVDMGQYYKSASELSSIIWCTVNTDGRWNVDPIGRILLYVRYNDYKYAGIQVKNFLSHCSNYRQSCRKRLQS